VSNSLSKNIALMELLIEFESGLSKMGDLSDLSLILSYLKELFIALWNGILPIMDEFF